MQQLLFLLVVQNMWRDKLVKRHRPEYCQAGVVCHLLHSSLHMSLQTGGLIEGISVVDARQNESVWVGGVSRES